MKVARIIATPEADHLRPMLGQGLASAGWRIERSSTAGDPPELVLALDVSLEAFSTACSGAAADQPAGRTALAVHLGSRHVGSEIPPALPTPIPALESEIRRLALAFAPHLRVNAITTPSAGNAIACAGEIIETVMLLVECPAMTGVVIGIDRPAVSHQAD